MTYHPLLNNQSMEVLIRGAKNEGIKISITTEVWKATQQGHQVCQRPLYLVAGTVNALSRSLPVPGRM